MQCSRCGAALTEGSRLCPVCGASAEEPPLPEPEGFWMAPSPDLQHPQVTAQPPKQPSTDLPPAQSAKAPSTRGWLPLLIAALAILLTTGILLLIALRAGKTEASQASVPQQTAERFADLWAERDLLGCEEYLAFSAQDALRKLYRERGLFGSVTDSEAQRENTRRRMEEAHAAAVRELQSSFGEDYEISTQAQLQNSYSGEELQQMLKHYRSSKLDADIELPAWVDYTSIEEMQIYRAQTLIRGGGKKNTRDVMLCLVQLDGRWRVLW